MEIDWDKVPDWISAISTAVGVVFAIYAYLNWKTPIYKTKELEFRHELAKKLSDLDMCFLMIDGKEDEFTASSDDARVLIKEAMRLFMSNMHFLTQRMGDDFLHAMDNVDALLEKADHGEPFTDEDNARLNVLTEFRQGLVNE